jgi:hypothetical protein
MQQMVRQGDLLLYLCILSDHTRYTSIGYVILPEYVLYTCTRHTPYDSIDYLPLEKAAQDSNTQPFKHKISLSRKQHSSISCSSPCLDTQTDNSTSDLFLLHILHNAKTTHASKLPAESSGNICIMPTFLRVTLCVACSAYQSLGRWRTGLFCHCAA